MKSEVFPHFFIVKNPGRHKTMNCPTFGGLFIAEGVLILINIPAGI